MGYTTAFKPVPTIYNHIPVIAKRCMIRVAGVITNPVLTSIIGTARQAVEVIYDNRKIYLDNEHGTGWIKLTQEETIPCEELKADKVICYLE